MPLPARSAPFACALPRRSAWVGCHPAFPRMPPARRPSSSRRHWARGCCSGQGCSAPAKQRRDGMPPRNSPCIQRHIVSAVWHDGAFPHSPPHIQTHAIAATRHGSAALRSSPRIRRHLSAAARRCWALCSPVSPRGADSPSISPGGAGCHWASSAACCLAQPARRCTARCARNRPPCAPFAAWPCSWAGRSPACSETPGIRLQLPSARRCSPCWRSGYARRPTQAIEERAALHFHRRLPSAQKRKTIGRLLRYRKFLGELCRCRKAGTSVVPAKSWLHTKGNRFANAETSGKCHGRMGTGSGRQ